MLEVVFMVKLGSWESQRVRRVVRSIFCRAEEGFEDGAGWREGVKIGARAGNVGSDGGPWGGESEPVTAGCGSAWFLNIS